MPEGMISFSSWKAVLAGPARSALERALPAFLMRQRWFGGKSRSIEEVVLRDAASVPGQASALLILEVRYHEGEDDLYFVPLVYLPTAEAQVCLDKNPAARVLTSNGGELCDASVDESFAQWLLQTAGHGTRLEFSSGTLVGTAGRSYREVRGDETQVLRAERNTSEQSNTSIRFGDKIIMKLFRHLAPGPNPDCEVTQYLSDFRRNPHVPAFVGSISYLAQQGRDITLAMFQKLVENQGDGWTWTLEELSRTFTSLAQGARERDALRPYQEAAKVLARRTAEMHLDLAADTDLADFRPRVMTREDRAALSLRLRQHAQRIFDGLELGMSRLPDDNVAPARLLLDRRRELLERFRGLEALEIPLKLTRIHGDYHLGQVLRVDQDFVILDFEGEPARSIGERRSLQSPLKDVAGMLRSFSYAAQASHLDFAARLPSDGGPLGLWAHQWEDAVAASFLSTYRSTVAGAGLIPEDDAELKLLLDAFLLDKALYELNYELNNRPAWARIPMLGILALGE